VNKGPSEGIDPTSTSASRRDETTLTMAMRQAGVEAAKKAGERKGSKPTAPASPRGLEAAELPMPAVLNKIAKSIEDPDTSAEVTAAKVPEKLAEGGAKRTSIDKIADEDAKRTSMDNAAESVSASEQGQVGLSKEATILEARRTSSTTKVKSPLSEEAAATSSTSLGAAKSAQKTHRGSVVSIASKETIQEIEEANIIEEEAEETDETPGKAAAPGMIANMTATSEREAAAMKDIKPQEQDPKDPEAAGVSVGD
jgi:hypothetical protein